MQNNVGPVHSFGLQQQFATQQAQQRGLQNSNFPFARSALFDQCGHSNQHNQFHLALPSAHGLINAIKPFPNYGILQAMRSVNHKSALDRERLFMATSRQREITAYAMTEIVMLQEKLILNNERALKKLAQSNSIALEKEPTAVQDGILGVGVKKGQPITPASTLDLCESDSVDVIKSKETYQNYEKPKTKQEMKWLLSYAKLKEYKAEYGDCIVPRGFALNPKLASWVAEQRKQHKLLQVGSVSSLTQSRVELLEEIGFVWNAQEAAWERHITELKSFKEENGDCLVPLNHPKYPKLGLWVKEQRRHYALMSQSLPSHMTEERAAALNAVGFCWDTHEAVWDERFRDLCQYKLQFGDCNVPTNYPNNPKLGTWVLHQRRQYKKYKERRSCHNSAERIRALEMIGFSWYPRKATRHSDNVPSDGDAESEIEDGEVPHRHKKPRRLMMS